MDLIDPKINLQSFLSKVHIRGKEVILAKRKMIPTNGEDFPLRKTSK